MTLLDNHPYFKVRPENRKGWQRKLGHDGPLVKMPSGNTYNIYAQDIPEIDMYTHFPRWITYLERCLGCPLQPQDYIFPYFAPKGIAHPDRQMTHDMVQSLINRFASAAGLTKTYTTHCFSEGPSTVSCMRPSASGGPFVRYDGGEDGLLGNM